MLFIDMDGVLVDFHVKNNKELRYKKGFYENLKPLNNLYKHINKLAKIRKDIYVLSHYIDTPFCIEEKTNWLKRYIPNLDITHYIPVKCYESKLEKAVSIFRVITKDDTLIDDDMRNITEWNKLGTGIIVTPKEDKLNLWRFIV